MDLEEVAGAAGIGRRLAPWLSSLTALRGHPPSSAPAIFQLAVAAAISIFGFEFGAALATVVGGLVEVPVMLSVVHIIMRSRAWYDRGARRMA